MRLDTTSVTTSTTAPRSISEEVPMTLNRSGMNLHVHHGLVSDGVAALAAQVVLHWCSTLLHPSHSRTSCRTSSFLMMSSLSIIEHMSRSNIVMVN